MGRGRRREPAVELVEAAPGPYRGQGGGQGTAGRGGVVDVVGGHYVDAGPGRQLHQGVVAGRVEGVAVVPQLDGHVVTAEGVDQTGKLVRRRRRSPLDEGTRDRPFPTAGEHVPVVMATAPTFAANRR